ncbi:mitotic spindle checkpoint protein MAD1 [Thalictrum thalictroides]|uniref:Mitotic spindle checkpoint protein MAD1 n=1 Tax=Thalictrum thalictroides TaxID=46969 RepID=A0A7J6VY56_THATH|nr:mitotic spindle checkpoint protein MAD1 [Thalictrum thalictroides]
MILRTPPPRKRRAMDSSPSSSNQQQQLEIAPPFDHPSSGGGGGRRLVIYEDPDTPLHRGSTHNHPPSDQMICTYQCRQMVKAEFLDAFESAEKQVKDYQSQLEALTLQLQKSGFLFTFKHLLHILYNIILVSQSFIFL